MLAPENRLVATRDFDAVYKNGRFFSFESVALKVAKNGLETTRVGLSVGLKFSPRAVDRNRAKRWLREIARKNLGEMKTGFDVVIMLKKESVFPTLQTLEQSFRGAILRGKLLIKS